MDNDIKKMKKFFTGMKEVSEDMLRLIEQSEAGNEPNEEEVATILGKFMILQMQADIL